MSSWIVVTGRGNVGAADDGVVGVVMGGEEAVRGMTAAIGGSVVVGVPGSDFRMSGAAAAAAAAAARVRVRVSADGERVEVVERAGVCIELSVVEVDVGEKAESDLRFVRLSWE